ncbi:MAG: hypothetical protein GY909_15970 [Oligoflexia bacterium]|nr:hypothetical protein [Oligoflexia bacterium]
MNSNLISEYIKAKIKKTQNAEEPYLDRNEYTFYYDEFEVFFNRFNNAKIEYSSKYLKDFMALIEKNVNKKHWHIKKQIS